MAIKENNNMKKHLLIVAHPDDEVLFFTGPLNEWGDDFHVVLVTDGNADGKGNTRQKEFEKVLSEFKVTSFELYHFLDIYEKEIPEKEFLEKLEVTLGKFLEPGSSIYTHGPFGEYGHPHHIQVSNYVHNSCLKNFTINHPNILDLPGSIFEFNDEDLYRKKLKLMTSIYRNEFSRFVTLLAPRMVEKHLQSTPDVLAISNYLLDKNKNLPDKMGGYEYFRESLILFKESGLTRRF